MSRRKSPGTVQDRYPCEVCGENRWKRQRTARRDRLVCCGCGHRRTVPRARGAFNN